MAKDILSEVMADIHKSYKKKNDTLIFNPNRQKEFISSGSNYIDMNMGGGLACKGRLVELSSFECITGDQRIKVKVNKDLPNNSKIIKQDTDREIPISGTMMTDENIIGVETISVLELMELVQNSKYQIEVETKDGFQPIGDFAVKGEKKILNIKFDDDTNIRVSKDHLVETVDLINRGYTGDSFTENGLNFIKSKWLESGDKVVSDNGYKIVSEVTYDDYEMVYDFEIKHKNHRYIANGVSHHNSGGKTTLALQTCVQAIRQYPDQVVLFFDAEGHMDITYANSLGLEIGDNFLVFQPDSAEEVEDILTRFIKKMADRISLVVFDSVAAIRPSSMAEHMHGESNQKAGHAFFWTDFSPKINNWAKKYDIAFLLLNQLRAKPSIGNMDKFSVGNTGLGAGFSNTDTSFTSTGGTALRFYLSARYLLRHISDVKEQTEDDVTGELIDLKIAKKYKIQNIKNKLTAPHKESNYIIRYGMGTDDSILVRDFLQSAKVITSSGSFINYKSSDGSLDFKENGKIRFMKKFTQPEIFADALQQFVDLKAGVRDIDEDVQTQEESNEETTDY